MYYVCGNLQAGFNFYTCLRGSLTTGQQPTNTASARWGDCGSVGRAALHELQVWWFSFWYYYCHSFCNKKPK